MREIGGMDSWNMVNDYLQNEGTMAFSQDDDEMSYHDESNYDDDDEDDYVSDEDEEDYDEDEDEQDDIEIEPIYSGHETHEMEKGEPEQSGPAISESTEYIPPPLIESPTPVIYVSDITPLPAPLVEQTVLQTQSPPVTPEQHPHPRKRNFIETETPIVLPATTTTTLLDPLPQESVQTNKRRRIDDEGTGKRGWLGIAKTVGKYTVAGAIGGAATFLGLLWSAQQ